MDSVKDIDELMWDAVDHHVEIKTKTGKIVKGVVDEYEGRGDCDRDDGLFSSIMISLEGEEDMGLVLWEDEIENIEILPGDDDPEEDE